MAYSERAIRMIPVVIGTLLLSLTTPNFSDLPSFEVKNPLERSNAIFKLQRIEEEDLKIEQAKKTLSFLNFDDLAFYRMTFLGQDIIYSNYHFWVFYCFVALYYRRLAVGNKPIFWGKESVRKAIILPSYRGSSRR